MPSREEIVEELSSISNWCEDNNATLALKTVTTQVSAMRCESCKRSVDCVAFIVMGEDALDFGCFSHEPKPAG